MVHIYTGEGKGKTTAAFGLAMRANGQGLKVVILQFFKTKGLACGEVISAKKLKNIRIVKCNECHPMFGGRKKKKAVEAMVKKAEKAILGGKYNMVILDEVINAMTQGFIKKERLIRLLKITAKEKELVLTGRGDISGIEAAADYITIMIDKKHPFGQRIRARKGIEY